MKIIDLLVKIANNEEVPKKIKCDGVFYNYEFQNTIIGAYEYKSQYGKCLMNNLAGHLYLTDILNNKVEIIEEKPKKIEKLELESLEEFKNNSVEEHYHKTAIEYDRINDLTKAVNYLLEKESDK